MNARVAQDAPMARIRRWPPNDIAVCFVSILDDCITAYFADVADARSARIIIDCIKRDIRDVGVHNRTSGGDNAPATAGINRQIGFGVCAVVGKPRPVVNVGKINF